jgi:hypothetical protein
MFAERKKKYGIEEFCDQIKETSIRRNFQKQKIASVEKANFLKVDPPEVILQSKFFLI